MTRPKGEGERLTAIPRCVELLAARDAHADVVHDRSLTGPGFFASAHDNVFN
jgi:hypothetical protein